MKLLTLLLGLAATLLAAININTATADELVTLKGIGPAKAKAIIDYRQTNRGFKKPEDILIVKGIGPKIYDAIKNDIKVAP